MAVACPAIFEVEEMARPSLAWYALRVRSNFEWAVNAALAGRDRTQATIEMTSELMRPATRDERYLVRGEVVRLARQIAYAQATITNDADELVSRATGTFLVHREGLDVLGGDLA